MAQTTKDGLTLIHNAKIYAFDEADYEWMLFDRHSGYIKAVGRKDPPISEPTPGGVIDLGWRRILPGLHESHIHLGSYGLTLTEFDASSCRSVDELKECLLTFAKNNPDKKWIHGRGWEQDRLGRYPDKSDLDSVCPDRPVLISRVCGHIAVANSKALALAGITKQTTDPEGGQIDRYPVGHPLSGEPTGIIREFTEKLFEDFLTPTKSDLLSAIRESIRHCLKNGVTSVHALEDNHTWDILCDLADQGQLPIRVFYVLFWENRKRHNIPEAGQYKGKLLSCDRVKLFSDGALGACTAALSFPYKGSDNNRGLLLHTQEQLNKLVSEATSSGYRLEMHAIGDAAADAVLTSLEEEKIAPEKRPIMVHCQILRKDLIKRMKSLGVIASIQPQFVPTDSRWIGDLLPDELVEYAYAWKTLFDNNVQCCGGSDAPVESPKPLRGIYDAIFRYTDDGRKTSYRPEESLSTKQAISLYTKGGAFAARREHDLGQLLPGFQADFIVLDSDPVQLPEEFCSTNVSQVWVAGVQRI